MTNPKDTKLGVGWRLEKQLGQAKLPRFPCLECGRETKVHHPVQILDKKTMQLSTLQRRICSHARCRKVLVIVPKFDFARGIRLAKQRLLESLQRRTGDSQTMSDENFVRLDDTVRDPIYPCSECGRETKVHHPVIDGNGTVEAHRRICASPSCRAIEVVPLN